MHNMLDLTVNELETLDAPDDQFMDFVAGVAFGVTFGTCFLVIGIAIT